MLDDDNPFWKFSIAVYAVAEVTSECLALQDTLGIDVNVLLFCAWRGQHGHALSETQIAAIEQRTNDWQTRVVRPLRAARRDVKTMPEMTRPEIQQFRAEIAAIELRAERFEQAMLFDAARGLAPEIAMASATDSIRHNIGTYLSRAARGQAYVEPAALIAAAANNK